MNDLQFALEHQGTVGSASQSEAMMLAVGLGPRGSGVKRLREKWLWVAQATCLFPPATRLTEREQRFEPWGLLFQS